MHSEIQDQCFLNEVPRLPAEQSSRYTRSSDFNAVTRRRVLSHAAKHGASLRSTGSRVQVVPCELTSQRKVAGAASHQHGLATLEAVELCSRHLSFGGL